MEKKNAHFINFNRSNTKIYPKNDIMYPANLVSRTAKNLEILRYINKSKIIYVCIHVCMYIGACIYVCNKLGNHEGQGRAWSSWV